jgi:hypothetical protein
MTFVTNVVLARGATMLCATILSAAKSPREPKITRPRPLSQYLHGGYSRGVHTYDQKTQT